MLASLLLLRQNYPLLIKLTHFIFSESTLRHSIEESKFTLSNLQEFLTETQYTTRLVSFLFDTGIRRKKENLHNDLLCYLSSTILERKTSYCPKKWGWWRWQYWASHQLKWKRSMIGTARHLVKLRFLRSQNQSSTVQDMKSIDHPTSNWWLRQAPPWGWLTWVWSLARIKANLFPSEETRKFWCEGKLSAWFRSKLRTLYCWVKNSKKIWRNIL